MPYSLDSGRPANPRSPTPPPDRVGDSPLLLLFFTLVTGPRRFSSLKLSDTRVYEDSLDSGELNLGDSEPAEGPAHGRECKQRERVATQNRFK